VNVDILMTTTSAAGTIGDFPREIWQGREGLGPGSRRDHPGSLHLHGRLKCHRNVQTLRDFVKEQGLRYYYDRSS